MCSLFRLLGNCPTGFEGTGDTNCTDINECFAANNGGCDTLTTCTNTIGSRSCGPCPSGYTGSGYTICNDVDECAQNNGGCDLLMNCTNTPGGFSCNSGCPR